MMLRSSSTPVLGSPLSSFSDSPQKLPTPNINQSCSKLSSNNGGFQNIAKYLSHSPSVAEIKGAQNGFRRAQSEGNLEEFVDDSYNAQDSVFSNQCRKKHAGKPTLEAIPSFSCHNLGTGSEDYGSDAGEREGELRAEGNSDPLVMQNLASHEVRANLDGCPNMGLLRGEGKMYLATGIGAPAASVGSDDGGYGGCGCGGGGGSCRPVDFSRDGGDSRGLGMEEYYRSMLGQSPGNPLFLRNYAHFLYQEKGDLEGAEEYYSRSILAEPEDGEVLCQYAKLIWELHRDKERAAAYFERAVQASSEDSHVNASYASFLWDIEEDEDEDGDEGNAACNSRLFHHGTVASETS